MKFSQYLTKRQKVFLATAFTDCEKTATNKSKEKFLHYYSQYMGYLTKNHYLDILYNAIRTKRNFCKKISNLS